MKTIETMITDTKKKAFTLIELLIVVAIIGILAGVGVPMYNGYMATAKIKSAETNHSNVKSFVAATLTKCSTGTTTVKLGSTDRTCADTTTQWASHFRIYFNSLNKNPYSAIDATTASTTIPLGATHIGNLGNAIRVRTNIGDEDGGNVMLPAASFEEITKE